MNKTGLKIKQLRLQKNFSQEELASAVGFKNASGISRIENGEREIKSDTLVKIAHALNVAPSELLKDPDTYFSSVCSDEIKVDRKYTPFVQYLPYLAKLSETELAVVRKILDMPEPDEGRKKDSCDSLKTAVS